MHAARTRIRRDMLSQYDGHTLIIKRRQQQQSLKVCAFTTPQHDDLADTKTVCAGFRQCLSH